MCLLKPLLNRHPAIYQALKNRHVWYNETPSPSPAQKASATFRVLPVSVE